MHEIFDIFKPTCYVVPRLASGEPEEEATVDTTSDDPSRDEGAP